MGSTWSSGEELASKPQVASKTPAQLASYQRTVSSQHFHIQHVPPGQRCRPATAAHLLQVARGAGGDLGITEDDLLGGAAAQGAHDARKDLLLADQAGVLACGGGWRGGAGRGWVGGAL